MFTTFRVLDEAVALAMASRLRDWEQGQARTAEATEKVKNNAEIVPRSEDDPHWESVALVRDAVMRHHGIKARTLLYRMTVPKFNRYSGGETYRRHYDASPMTLPEMRTDFSCTLFLTPPDEYDGGVLHVESPEGGIVKAPKGDPGTAVIYECGNAHWVTPVTRGARVSSVFWIRSMVKSPEQRRLLVQLTDLVGSWERSGEPLEVYGDEFTTLTGIQTALCRMWMDT